MKFFQILIKLLLFKITMIFGMSIDTDYIAAIVNNHVILSSDIQNKIKILKYNALYDVSLNALQDEQTYKIILDQLIINSLIFQTITQNNFKLDPNDTDKIISSIANFKDMTLSQFNEYLISIDLNHKKYFSEINQDLLKKEICKYAVYQHSNYISHNEIENIAQELNFIDFNKQFKLQHIIIDLPIQASCFQINTSKKLAELIIQSNQSNQNIITVIKKYYSKNILPNITVKEIEWIHWKNIPVIFDKYLATAKTGDIIGPVQSYDGIHILIIQDIRIQQCIFPVIKVKINDIISKDTSNNISIRQQLLHIKQDIENANTTLTMITKEKAQDFYSNNYENSEKWIDIDNFEPIIQKSILSLKKHHISMPIYTTTGWYLIKLIDINKLSYSEIIYERSYSYLVQQKFNEILNNWITELKSQSYIKAVNS